MTFYDNTLTLYHLTDPNPNGDRCQVVFAVVPHKRKGFDAKPVIGYGVFTSNGSDMYRGHNTQHLWGGDTIDAKRVYSVDDARRLWDFYITHKGFTVKQKVTIKSGLTDACIEENMDIWAKKEFGNRAPFRPDKKISTNYALEA